MNKFREKMANEPRIWPRWIIIGFMPGLTLVVLKTYVKDWVESRLFIDWNEYNRQ